MFPLLSTGSKVAAKTNCLENLSLESNMAAIREFTNVMNRVQVGNIVVTGSKVSQIYKMAVRKTNLLI
jgi:hypothetical protein